MVKYIVRMLGGGVMTEVSSSKPVTAASLIHTVAMAKPLPNGMSYKMLCGRNELKDDEEIESYEETVELTIVPKDCLPSNYYPWDPRSYCGSCLKLCDDGTAMAKRWEVDDPFVRYWTYSGSFERRTDNTVVVQFDTVVIEWGVSVKGQAQKGKGKGKRFNHRKLACPAVEVLHVTVDMNLELKAGSVAWPSDRAGTFTTFYRPGYDLYGKGKGMGKDKGMEDSKGKGKGHVYGTGKAYNEDDDKSEAEGQAKREAECEAKGQEMDKGKGKVKKYGESSGYSKGNGEGKGSSDMKACDQEDDLEDRRTSHSHADCGKKCMD